jgi:putative hemolysin
LLALDLTVILLLVLANAVLAGSEIAVVTSRKARLRHRAESGDAGARRALELANAPNRFLSTVQIGITAVAVVAGAFSGARVAGTVAPLLAGVGVPARLAEEAALLLVVAAVTFLTLVVGELVPKRVALHDPERAAARVAGLMHLLSRLASPLVRLLGVSTELVLRLLPLKERTEAEITEDEIRGMIAHATETGVLEPTEQQIMERLFRLSDTTLAMIMTPREAVVWVDRSASRESWAARLADVVHTRYIVADGSLDEYVGYVDVRELLRQLLDAGAIDVAAGLRQPHVLPHWTPAFRLLELFQWSGDHVALVTDEAGRVQGLVTLNDLLEGIVGEIVETHEVVAPGVVAREDGSWLVDGLLGFETFLRTFDRTDPSLPHFATLHAFMVERLDGRPHAAAVVHWRGLRLEVVDMDGRRVDKVLVERLT